MKKNLRYIIGGLVILASLALPFLLEKNDEPYTQGRSFPMMGTVGRITIYSDRKELQEKTLDQVQKIIREIEAVCNIFNPESELSKLNRTAYGQDFVCSPLLWEMLCAADRHNRFSSGAYDPTVSALMQLWGFRSKRQTVPSEAEISDTLKKVGWKKVKLDREKHSVRFLTEGLRLDFGGIAKGFALDKTREVLLRAGIRHAVLDFGGNIGTVSEEKHAPFRIGIRDPEMSGHLIETLEMRNQCAATSGSYERYVLIGGKEYSHIMDPRTGKPVTGMLSVTVVTPRGTDSDALSTAIFVNGEKFADQVCRKIPDTGVLIVRRAPDRSSGTVVRRFGSLAR